MSPYLADIRKWTRRHEFKSYMKIISKIQYVIAIHLMRWMTNFYDFRFKWTATAAIGIHPTKAWLSQLVNFKKQSDTLKERYAIKLCFKLATKTYGMLPTDFRPSCRNQASVFEWHKRFKEGRESMREDDRCGRSKEVNRPELIGQRVKEGLGYYVEVLREFRKRFRRKTPGLSKSGQWHFQQDNAQSTTPSLSQTIWPRWASRWFLSLL